MHSRNLKGIRISFLTNMALDCSNSCVKIELLFVWLLQSLQMKLLSSTMHP